MADQISPDLLEELGSAQFDSKRCLSKLFEADRSFIKDLKKLENLQWTLRQLEAQYATEFEAKAVQYKDQIPMIHSSWNKCIADEQTGLISLQQSYEEALGQIKSRLGSAEFEAFNRMISIENSRTKLAAMKQMMDDEKEWRRVVGEFQEAVDSKDLDVAQARLEALDRFSEAMKSEVKRAKLGKLKQAFVAAVRSS